MRVILRHGWKVIAIALLLELFIFNFKHWESLGFKAIDNFSVSYGSGLEQFGDKLFLINDKGNAFLEVSGFDEHISNVYLDIAIENAAIGVKVPVQIQITDDANSQYRLLAETEVVKGIRESNYIRLHLIGKSTKVRINLKTEEGMVLRLDEVGLNQVRPLMISGLRILVILLIEILYLLFQSKSYLYNCEINMREKWQRYLIGFMVTIQVILIGIVGLSALPFLYWKNDTWEAHAQYEDLTDALLDGHFYLNQEPPRFLVEMDNPYDSILRAQLSQQAGEGFLFDFAYYDGYYYCYFGIVPALLFFVPFKLLTGGHLQTWIPIVFCGMLYVISAFAFIYQLIKKYFSKTSVGLYLLLSSVFVAASAIVYLVHFGNVYSMPIMLGLLLGITGLACWLKACDKGKEPDKKWLVAGAISIALIMGCRPQLAVVLLFAFPIFWNEIKAGYFFSKKGIWNTLSVIMPFLVVGFALMYYNYARFGSPLDFGANYNLTSNDMTHKGFVFSRNFLGLFEYLLQPFNTMSKFPFLRTIDLQTEYQGYISSEPLLCGFLMMNLITVFSFGVFKCKKWMKEKGVFCFALISLVSALVIVEVDIQMSGLTQRYMSDFGWLFTIPTILVLLTIHEQMKEKREVYSYLLRGTVVLSVVCIFLNYFSLFAIGRYASLIDVNPYMFYLMKYMFFKC